MANEGSRHRIGAEFFRKWPIDALAAQPDWWLNQQGRLTQPMVRREGAAHYEPIEWDEAFALIAHELTHLESPDHAAFYTSGRASNEAAFLYQLFARRFGTNNLPDCSNMCHESSGTALVESLGIGKGTVTLEDFEQTDLIVIIGHNPGTNHPRMLTSLEHAKKHGAKIIAINPLPEPGLMRFTDPNPQEYPNPVSFAAHLLGTGTALADLHLPVRINGDIALAKGLMKVLLAEEAEHGGVIDHEFIREYTDGFDALVADLESTSWQAIVDGSQIPREDIERAGRMMAGAKRMICCWAMGMTQHRDAVAGIQIMVDSPPARRTHRLPRRRNLLRPRAFERPGRSDGRDLGAADRPIPRRARPRVSVRATAPRGQGHGRHDRRNARGLDPGLRGTRRQFPRRTPDTACTAEAMRRCGLTAQIATTLNRGHLITGRQALLLPCLGRSERDPSGFVTVEDAFGIISSSRGSLQPAAPDLRSESAIIGGIAHATLGSDQGIGWHGLSADYSRIRDHISRVVPGFERYNERIEEGPFYLPNPARDRRFVTATKRARFTVAPISEHNLEPDQYLMTTIRSHDQFNTTVYGLHDRYRGVHGGRRVLFMNRDDAAERGWTGGVRVDITSHFGDERRVARSFQIVPFPIPRHCVAAYFPEANVLVPVGSVAERSNTPTSKSIHVSLAPAA